MAVKRRDGWWKEYRQKNLEKIRAYDKVRNRKRYIPHPKPRLTKEEKIESRRKSEKSHYERIKREKSKAYYQALRNAFLQMYGSKCACCGEKIREFLTMEHKQGLIGQKRKAGTTGYKIAVTEYRPDLYETLCMNCNHAKGRIGYCPHNPERYGVKLE